MQDLPKPEQLLAAVARFLRDDAGPALARHGDNALAYQARVAANMVDTVARQTTLGPAADAAERRRLQALLGLRDDDPDVADLAALNRHLTSRIADGTLVSSHPGLADHLWATTLAKLAVDQPAYDTHQRHQAPAP
ncbi:MAG: DUF6285 domain-containing protein [Pseudomonadota bacterium]